MLSPLWGGRTLTILLISIIDYLLSISVGIDYRVPSHIPASHAVTIHVSQWMLSREGMYISPLT
jgi:hypothetical protein